MRRFARYIGVDYSGAQHAESFLDGLAVYLATGDAEPGKQTSPDPSHRRWNRSELAGWLLERLSEPIPTIVGIDHAFSLPITYFTRYGLSTWDAFLDDFVKHYPLHERRCTVQALSDGSWWSGRERPEGERSGNSHEFRLTERWTAGAKSAFLFDVQGAVAASTHTGLPWLRWLRRSLGERVHVWPFDGWELPDAGSALVEVYPAVLKKRYESRQDQSTHEFDAFATAAWLRDMDGRGALVRYLHPPLTPQDRQQAALEGWILGVG